MDLLYMCKAYYNMFTIQLQNRPERRLLKAEKGWKRIAR